MPLNIPVLSLITLWNRHGLCLLTQTVKERVHLVAAIYIWLYWHDWCIMGIPFMLSTLPCMHSCVCVHACIISHRNKCAVVLCFGFTYDEYLVQGMFLFFRLLHWHWVSQSASEVTLKDIGNNNVAPTQPHIPDSKVHGANMLAPWTSLSGMFDIQHVYIIHTMYIVTQREVTNQSTYIYMLSKLCVESCLFGSQNIYC